MNYEHGSLFAVPLRTTGYALGLIARTSPKGRIILAYFFDHFMKTGSHEPVGMDLTAASALGCWRVGDLGLIAGTWPLIGRLRDWKLSDWPFPRFIRREPLSGRTWMCIYDDHDPSKLVEEVAASPETVGFEEDKLLGAGVVEVLLTTRLNPK